MEGLMLGSFGPEQWWFATFLGSVPSSPQTFPSKSSPSITVAPIEGMCSSRGSLSPTTAIPIHGSSAKSSELIVQPHVRTESKFLVLPSNRDLYLFLDLYRLSLEPIPLQLVMLFQKYPLHHPLCQYKSLDLFQPKTSTFSTCALI